MPQANRTPYTQVLSALRKTDLVRLCVEFRLSADGSVVRLRQRLKDYLNLHRDRLYHNARYTALFPRHRRVNQQPPAPPPSSRSPSPPASSRSQSPYGSDDSWHGIGGDLPPHQQPPHQHLPPRSQSPAQDFQEQPYFPDFPEGSAPFIHPQHSRSPSFSRRGSPPIAIVDPRRKYHLTPGYDPSFLFLFSFSRHYAVSYVICGLLFAPMTIITGTM
jgi:hypothetical protein